VENLKLTAILNCTRFFVTHVSILTSDISSNIFQYTFANVQNVLLPILESSILILLLESIEKNATIPYKGVYALSQ